MFPKIALSLLCVSTLQVSPLLLQPAADAAKAKKTRDSAAASASAAQTDDEAVTAQLKSLSESLAQGNSKAVAALWAEDGNYIDDDGLEFKGRAAVEKRFTTVFETDGKLNIECINNSIRTLAPGVVLAEGVVRRKGVSAEALPETRYSMVFTERDGAWLISSASERPYVAGPPVNPLKPLSWMVGEWSAEEKGGYVHMKADWAANGNFITCQYETQKSVDAPKVDSRQVIGWDPRTGLPVSWHFDSDGGFGYGDWVKKDNQWLVTATGVERDGSITTATNIMSVSDPNTFSWQSLNRRINGIVFADTAPLKVQRVNK
jgi:uncharacterized protein (TIGR02246 family)